jgi:hypothetical protein
VTFPVRNLGTALPEKLRNEMGADRCQSDAETLMAGADNDVIRDMSDEGNAID